MTDNNSLSGDSVNKDVVNKYRLFDLDIDSLRDLIEAVPDPMVIVDSDGDIVVASSQTERVFLYTPEELIGQPVETLLPERFRHGHVKHRNSYRKNAKPRTMGTGLELYGRRKDGTEFPVEVALSPVRTKYGLLISSTIRDVTEHFEAKQNLTGILESSQNEIYIFDEVSLRFIQVNNGARKNLGYTMAELVKLTPVDLKPDFTTVSFCEIIQPLTSNETSKLQFITRHQRRDGSTYPVEVHLQRAILDTRPVLVAIVLDITERREAELALQHANERLEHKVNRRTADLADANATRSRFLAAASHDLRQPLQSLGLYLSVLERTSANPDQLEVATKMRSSLDTMGELLDALLDVARLDSGSINPQKSHFKISDVLARIVNDNLQQARRKNLPLTCAQSDCLVYSDPVLLARVIDNFVTNAIRYTHEGNIHIECECADDTVTVTVKDTGIGIPDEELSQVFEEYYQLGNPVRDRRKGLGLGLAIVKHIARLLDHAVTVESEFGEGSSFSVQVPLGRSVLQSHPAKLDNASQGRQIEPKILLIDDDPSVLDATSLFLKTENMQVTATEDAGSALSLLRSGFRPDVIVSDYRLPDTNGVELVRLAREILGVCVPVVIITGDTTANELIADDLKECSLLHKPVNTDKLVNLINASQKRSD